MAIDYVRIRILWKKNQAAGLRWVEMGERGRGLVNRVGATYTQKILRKSGRVVRPLILKFEAPRLVPCRQTDKFVTWNFWVKTFSHVREWSTEFPLVILVLILLHVNYVFISFSHLTVTIVLSAVNTEEGEYRKSLLLFSLFLNNVIEYTH